MVEPYVPIRAKRLFGIIPWGTEGGTPQVTPQVEEPQETAFQNWARRLIVGPREIVRQQLADAAAREREQFRVEREDIRAQSTERREDLRAQSAERRGRENILLQIREQARVNQEKEERGVAREWERRGAVRRAGAEARAGLPPEELAEGVPALSELLFGAGAKPEEITALRPEKEKPVVVGRESRLTTPSGRVILEGEPRPEKSFFEGKNEAELLGILNELNTLSSPTPEQQAQARLIQRTLGGVPGQGLQERMGERAGVRAEATAKAQRGLPAKNWQNWFHPGTMVAAPGGLSEGELIGQGYIELDPEQRKAVRALKQVSGTITVLKGLADKVITAQTPVEAQAQALKYGGSVKFALTAALFPAAKVYHDDVEGFLGPLSRSPLVAERGVLTNQDIERMRRVFPWFGDTQGIRDMKFTILEFLLTSARDAAIRGLLFDEMPSAEYTAAKEKFLRQLESITTSATPKTGTPVEIGGKKGRVVK